MLAAFTGITLDATGPSYVSVSTAVPTRSPDVTTAVRVDPLPLDPLHMMLVSDTHALTSETVFPARTHSLWSALVTREPTTVTLIAPVEAMFACSTLLGAT